METSEQSIESVLRARLGSIRVVPDAEAAKAVSDERAKQHAAMVERLRQSWNAPERHLRRDSVDMSGPWGEFLETIQKSLGTGRMWAICGTRGNGKTQMAVEAMKKATLLGMSARYLWAAEFFDEIKATFKKDNSMTGVKVIEKFRKPQLLVIDEIGKRGETDWENNLLFLLLDKRYADMTDTIVLANLDSSKMAESIGPSLADRIGETGGLIECNWPSRR